MTADTAQRPLYVDLDGTLIASDTLWESLALLLRVKPWLVFLVPIWVLSGRLGLKSALYRHVRPDPALLPYRPEVLDYIDQAKASGRRVVLATAAHRGIADAVAAHVNRFDAVLGSENEVNLKGAHKLEAIRRDAGGGAFAYAGDSSADLPIWRAAAGAVLVGPGHLFAGVLGATPIEARLAPQGKPLKPLLKAIRPHQWIKNILVFLPLIAAHRMTDVTAVTQAAVLFVAFSLCASGVYLINDLVDIEHDRAHPKKRRRPFAAGTLPVQLGLLIAPLFSVIALGMAAWISWATLGMLVLYVVITTAYSFSLKRILLVDVFTLAGLYTLRSASGNVAADIPTSPWLMAFLVFLFLSLAFCKRYAELDQVVRRDGSSASGRGYLATDLLPVGLFGVAAGFIAALVLGLYVTGSTVATLYANPSVLWLAAPIVLYWMCSIWIVTWRGQMHDDPIVFAAKDRKTYVVAAVMVLLIICAGPKGGA